MILYTAMLLQNQPFAPVWSKMDIFQGVMLCKNAGTYLSTIEDPWPLVRDFKGGTVELSKYRTDANNNHGYYCFRSQFWMDDVRNQDDF